MKKILYSIMMIGIVAALIGSGTFAYFLQSETTGTSSFSTADFLTTFTPMWTVWALNDDPLVDTGVTAPFSGSENLVITGMMPLDEGHVCIDLTLDGVSALNPCDVYLTISANDNAILANLINIEIWADDGNGVIGMGESADITGTLESLKVTPQITHDAATDDVHIGFWYQLDETATLDDAGTVEFTLTVTAIQDGAPSP